jgi:hypothetical protein
MKHTINEMRRLIDNFNNVSINEGFLDDIISGGKTSWKRNVTGTYEEPIMIWVFPNKNNQAYIQNNFLNGKVNKKLMDLLDHKFGLNFFKDKKGHHTSSIFNIDDSKLPEISEFLSNIGLEKVDLGNGDYVFKGKLSLKNL